MAAKKNILLNLVFTAFGLIFALVVVELLFRALYSTAKPSTSWSDRPQAYFMPKGSHFLQDKGYTIENPSKAFRVVVMGDSFSFGPNMQLDDIYSERLERWLNLEDAATEVINISRSGLATHNQKVLLNEALRYRPDLIIFQITLNDAEDKSLSPAERDVLFSWPLLKLPIFSYWKSAHYVLQRLHNSRTHKLYIDYFEGLFNNQRLYKQFSDSLLQIKNVCEQNQISFVAVVFPLFDFPLNRKYPFRPVHKKIHQALEHADINYLDLLSAYHNIPFERLQVIPGEDSHPNEIAHRIAAERLLAWLAHENLLPENILPKHYYKSRSAVSSPHMVRAIKSLHKQSEKGEKRRADTENDNK